MKTQRARKLKPAGLNLWSVKLFEHDPEGNLWITTRTRCMARAHAKAKAFLKANQAEYQHGKIESIKDEGIIDA